MQDESFDHEIIEHLAVLSENKDARYVIELNMVSFGGCPPKLDIRRWDKRSDRPLKGISLTDAEADELKVALEKYLA